MGVHMVDDAERQRREAAAVARDLRRLADRLESDYLSAGLVLEAIGALGAAGQRLAAAAEHGLAVSVARAYDDGSRSRNRRLL